MPRVVLDPNVLVSALIAPAGASARLLVELHAGAFELITSPLLLGELSDVLRRPKFRRYLAEDEVEAFIELLRRTSTVVDDPEPPTRGLSDDPGDEYLITLTRSERADALVSGDHHLVELADRIPVKTPREFIHALTRE